MQQGAGEGSILSTPVNAQVWASGLRLGRLLSHLRIVLSFG
jgi:hypothetical protein